MTQWRFSDGTTVQLGGKVEGASLFAQELRAELEQDFVGVQIWPMGFDGVELDRDKVELLHAWLMQEMDRPFRREMKLTLLEQPAHIPELPPPPEDEDAPPDDADVAY